MSRLAGCSTVLWFLLVPACDDDGGGGDGGGDVCPVVGYVACGGDLVGTWNFAGQCAEAPEDVPCESPFDDPACVGGENSQTCVLDPEGTMTFTATDVGIVRDLSIDVTYEFTPACLAAVHPEASTPEAGCAAVANPPNLTCSFADRLCTCTARTEPEPSDEMVDYAIDGNMFTLAGELTGTYCVEGDTLTMDFAVHPMSWRYWVLTR